MNVKKILLHNFLSHTDSTLNLQEDGVYNLLGPTGAGKSSIKDALTWCLFGKSRVDGAGDELMHSGKSDMSVRVELEINGKLLSILREKKLGESTKLIVEEL